MKNLKKHIPNLLTLANLACGLLGIEAIFSQNIAFAAIMLGGSLIFDFLDGLAARALRVSSEVGLQLDSLADLVSFGVSPGFLMFALIHESVEGMTGIYVFLPYVALIIPLLSALRLARFNVDTRQTNYFIGLPTPSNAILLYSLALWMIYTDHPGISEFLSAPWFLPIISLVGSVLLIAELPLMSFKLKGLGWKENRGQILLVAGTVILLVAIGLPAFVFVIPLYLILSLIFKPRENEI